MPILLIKLSFLFLNNLIHFITISHQQILLNSKVLIVQIIIVKNTFYVRYCE